MASVHQSKPVPKVAVSTSAGVFIKEVPIAFIVVSDAGSRHSEEVDKGCKSLNVMAKNFVPQRALNWRILKKVFARFNRSFDATF